MPAIVSLGRFLPCLSVRVRDHRGGGIAKPLVGIAEVSLRGRVPWVEGYNNDGKRESLVVVESLGNMRMLRQQLGDTKLDKVKQSITGAATFASHLIGARCDGRHPFVAMGFLTRRPRISRPLRHDARA